MPLSVLCSTRLHEAVVTGQVMSHAIPPAWSFLFVKVRKCFGDETVNGAQGHALGWYTQNPLSDNGDKRLGEIS